MAWQKQAGIEEATGAKAELLRLMSDAFMVAEIAMASVNSGAANVTRAQAEKLLDDYFARVEQVVPWTENNPLDRHPSTITGNQESAARAKGLKAASS